MQIDSLQNDRLTLPGGRTLDLRRRRSEGPLDPEELSYCRSLNVPLHYDPAQIGWVSAFCEDDLAPYVRVAPPGPEPRQASQAERMRFRPWRSDEVATFVALLDDPEVWEHLPEDYPNPLAEDAAAALIELSCTARHHDVRAVEVDGVAVGQVRLAFPSPSDTRTEGEISYWLGRRHWGRGLGSRMVAMFTAECFRDRPELRFVWARVHERNAASARILEKAGYRQIEPLSGSPSWRRYRVDRAAFPRRL